MANCQGCGAALKPDARFCDSCGTAVAGAAPAAPPSSAPPPIADQASVLAAQAAALSANAARGAADRFRASASEHGVMGGGAITYDPSQIERLATTLYRYAFWILIAFTFLGALNGFIMGNAFSRMSAMMSGSFGGDSGGGIGWLVGLLFGGGFGYLVGLIIATLLKLFAQHGLAQVAIEQRSGR